MDDLAKIIPNTIRKKIAIFQELAREGKVDWFCFLIHAFPKDPDNAYFHVRFTKAEGEKIELPEYCIETQMKNVGKTISGIDESLLKNEDIREAWRMIGEQSDLIIKLVQIHKDVIPIEQFIQFMHYNMNMFGLSQQGSIKVRHKVSGGFISRFLRF